MTFECQDIDGANEQADWRAAQTGLLLADFECRHGNIERCIDCIADDLTALELLDHEEEAFRL